MKDSGGSGNYLMAMQGLMSVRAASDPAAFFAEFYAPVRRYVAAATGAPEADVEDLVQETLLGAWRNRARFRGESSWLTWVLSIAKNQIRARGRSEGRRNLHERIRYALRAVDTELIPEDLLETAETARRVRQALLDIDEAQAELLVRRYFDGIPVRRIADESRETEKAVQSRLHRARESLRERLKEGAADESE